MLLTEYKRICSVLQSLRDRTDTLVRLKNESYRIYHRNSDFASHIEVEIGRGHGVPFLIQLEDGVFLAPSDGVRIPEKVKNYLEEVIPGHMVRFINRTVNFPLPEWVTRKFVMVFVPNYFSGYDENGKPIFKATPFIEFEGGVGFNGQYPDEADEASEDKTESKVSEPDISI